DEDSSSPAAGLQLSAAGQPRLDSREPAPCQPAVRAAALGHARADSGRCAVWSVRLADESGRWRRLLPTRSAGLRWAGLRCTNAWQLGPAQGRRLWPADAVSSRHTPCAVIRTAGTKPGPGESQVRIELSSPGASLLPAAVSGAINAALGRTISNDRH